MPARVIYPEKFCLTCGKKLILICKRDIERKKFCSRSCLAIYYHKKGIFVIKHKYKFPKERKKKYRLMFGGPNNPRWKRIKRKCPTCRKIFDAKPIKSAKTKFQLFCSWKCFLDRPLKYRRYVSRTIKNCEICGKKMYLLPYQTKPGPTYKRFCSRRCTAIYAATVMNKKDTSIEKKVEEFLEIFKVKYKKQYRISNLTIADFFIKPNILIYCDGDYWHSRPEVQKRDQKIMKRLEALNYKVCRLSETQIKLGIENVSLLLSPLLQRNNVNYSQ